MCLGEDDIFKVNFLAILVSWLNFLGFLYVYTLLNFGVIFPLVSLMSV